MKVLQTMLGVLLLFLFDVAVLNTLSLRQYIVAPPLEEAIKSFIVRFDTVVKYLFLGVLLIATMIAGNLIGSGVRKKKTPRRGYE